MVKLQAFGYEYVPDGIILTVIYSIGEETKVIKKLYPGATEINFDWEEEARKIVSGFISRVIDLEEE